MEDNNLGVDKVEFVASAPAPKSNVDKHKIYIFVSGVVLGLIVMSLIGQGITGAAISKNDAKETISKYLDTVLTARGLKYTVDAVNDKGEVYIIDLTIESGTDKVPAQVGLTKDGKYFLPTVQDLKATAVTGAATTTPKDYPKSDKPKIDLFYMSFCPYGQIAVGGQAPVAKLFGYKIAFEPHFVIYGPENYAGQEDKYCVGKKYCSMHGVDEAMEDVRQICIFKNNKDKFWDYVTKINKDCKVSTISTCWKTVAAVVGLDAAAVEECANTNAEAYLKAEYDLCQDKDVQGSPTIFINGKDYAGGRTPEEYKTAICSAFNTAPEECKTVLSGEGSEVKGSC